MNEKLVEPFMKWLKAFEASCAATSAEGLRGLVVKLGPHPTSQDHADAASVQVDSAYADLVRLTGQDPATDISSRFERKAA